MDHLPGGAQVGGGRSTEVHRAASEGHLRGRQHGAHVDADSGFAACFGALEGERNAGNMAMLTLRVAEKLAFAATFGLWQHGNMDFSPLAISAKRNAIGRVGDFSCCHVASAQ